MNFIILRAAFSEAVEVTPSQLLISVSFSWMLSWDVVGECFQKNHENIKRPRAFILLHTRTVTSQSVVFQFKYDFSRESQLPTRIEVGVI